MHSQRLIYYKFGDPEHVLQVEETPVSSLKNDEILVQMHTRPINPSDIIPITGAYSHRIALPAIPGYEGVGVVVDVGRSVSQNLIGKRVLPLRGEGTWQQFVKTSVQWAIPIPPTIADETAAQLYINPLTAWLTCMEQLILQPGHDLLINAAGSSLGRIYAQMSNIFGFRLIAATRNDTYTAELLKLGASHIINTSEISLQETVMDLTNGEGVHAAIDCIGGTAGTELASCVQRNGTFLSVGSMSGQQVNWAEIASRMDISMQMFHLRHWNERMTVQTWHDKFEYIIHSINDEKLKLMPVAAHYHLSDVKAAIRAIAAMKSNEGKVFLTS